MDALATTFALQAFSPRSSYFPLELLFTWSVAWLGCTALIAFFIFQLLKYQRHSWAQILCLSAVTVNLILIFSNCPMDLSDNLKPDLLGIIDPKSAAFRFLIEENTKAVAEIRSRDEQENSWFHDKFILVGALLAATTGYIGFRKRESQSAEGHLTALSKSPSTPVILALACVLALGIDMHVRGSNCEVNQIGLWIRYYLEPVMLHGRSDCDSVTSLPTTFYGWEEFLRVKGTPPASAAAPACTPGRNPSAEISKHNASTNKTVNWDPSTGSGKHSGELWNFFYAPHIHFLTVFLYLLYLAVFQTFACLVKTGRGSVERRIPIVCFAAVHASFFAFAWIAHSAPEMFCLKVLPFVPAYETGYLVPLHYFVPCLAIILLNTPYILLYCSKNS